jgi:hypothetical protein
MHLSLSFILRVGDLLPTPGGDVPAECTQVGVHIKPSGLDRPPQNRLLAPALTLAQSL